MVISVEVGDVGERNSPGYGSDEGLKSLHPLDSGVVEFLQVEEFSAQVSCQFGRPLEEQGHFTLDER